MTVTVALPEQLAPALVARVQQLLAEVTPIVAPRRPFPERTEYRGPRCVVCHEGGRLGGHHGEDGAIEWIHRSCHRHLHNRHKGKRPARRLS
jgi:hypothetical protein